MGRFLEARSKSKAGNAIRKLLSLAPPLATCFATARKRQYRPQRSRWMNLSSRPGERFPVDGIVTSGTHLS
jgi:P-type Cu+ transporter